MEDSVEGPRQPNHWLRPYYIGFLPEILQGRKRSWLGCLSHSHVWNFYTFFSLTYKVGAPIPITGVQFGMRVEFGYDCLIPADFNNDVSLKTFKIPHLSYSRETHTTFIFSYTSSMHVACHIFAKRYSHRLLLELQSLRAQNPKLKNSHSSRRYRIRFLSSVKAWNGTKSIFL